MLTIKSAGFTLIELVVVVVLMGLLAAVAIPRFMNFSDEARTSVVSSIGGALTSGLKLAHAQWELKGRSTQFFDLDGNGTGETYFNAQGWPTGISADGVNKLSDLTDGGESGNDACGQLFKSVLETAGFSVIAGDISGECTSGDFCATVDETGAICRYRYRPTDEEIMYYSETGEVVFPEP